MALTLAQTSALQMESVRPKQLRPLQGFKVRPRRAFLVQL